MKNLLENRLRILIVDNFDETLELYSSVFKAVGYSVKRVNPSLEVLVAVQKFRPNAVFASIGGTLDKGALDLCLALRATSTCSEAQIIAVSNYGISTHDRSLVALFDNVFVKPIGLQRMLETLQSVEGYKGSEFLHIRIP